MKKDNIEEVEFECRRFLKRLAELKENQPSAFKKTEPSSRLYPSKETGALKRSSLDLTRSLSKMRNETY